MKEQTINNGEVVYNRAKVWQIGGFVMNNMSTNIAHNFLMMYFLFFNQNILGLSAVIIGVLMTCMRAFDGITDPIVGWLLDRTNTKFGKFRPFMCLGCIIIVFGLLMIFNCPTNLSSQGKYIYITVFYAIYIIGYTFQTACTKAAQVVLTNDPKQRPVFSMFDSAYMAVIKGFLPLLVTTVLASRYELQMQDPKLWTDVCLLFCIAMVVLTICAVISIWEKDRPEHFGAKNKQGKIKIKDYKKLIVGNRPLQMLIVASATDKLANLMSTALRVYVFSNLLLNNSLNGKFFSSIMIPVMVVSVLAMFWARKVGLKKAFLFGTWGSAIMLVAMWFTGAKPENTTLFLIFFFLQYAFANISNNICIPMIADTTDYATAELGIFAPGMIGTFFSFVDKMISSLSSTLAGLALALAGVATGVIQTNTFISDKFNATILLFFCGIPLLGHIASIIAMKFYNLNSKKMEEIQSKIAVLSKEA